MSTHKIHLHILDKAQVISELIIVFISTVFPKCSSLCIGPFSLRLAPYLEPSSTMVALEWTDVEPLIGYKVSDYIIQHKRVEDPSEAEVYTGTKINSVIINFLLTFAFCPILPKKVKAISFCSLIFPKVGTRVD